MKKSVLVAFFLLVIGVFAFANGQPEQKVLHMYTAFDTAEAQYYIEAYEKQTGVDVQWVRLSAGEVLARVAAEAANPQASVWFGGSNTSHIDAVSKGLLAPYKPNIDFTLADSFHDSNWMWTGIYNGAIGFVSNKNFLQKNNIPAPTSWQDLLNPVFKNNVVIAYPYTSGTSYTTYATLIQLYGLDKTLAFWKQFDQQSVFQYTKSGTGGIPMAGLGQCAVAIGFSHDIVAKGIDQGYPVVMSFPKEGTGYEVGAVALIKGGKEPALAKQFIDWSLSVPAQNLYQKYERLPLNPNATVSKGAVRMSEIKLIDYDAQKMGLNQDKYIQAWRDAIGK
jgi:iron(III) transport system substrate-binding protein